MKRLGLSLVTASLLISGAIANESLVDALTTNAKINGQVRLMYQSGSNTNIAGVAAHRNENTASSAVDLSYVTGSFYGFKFGITGQAGWDFRIHNEDNNAVGKGDEDDYRNSVTTRELSQLYLEYGYSKSQIKIGRQFLTTPLIHDGRIMFPLRDSFDAVNVKINEIPNTLVQLIYVDQWNKQYHTDANQADPTHWLYSREQDVEYKDGLWSIYLKNNSYKPLQADFQYVKVGSQQDEIVSNGDGPLSIVGGYDFFQARASYQLPINYLLKIGVLYGGVTYDERQTKAPSGDYGGMFATELTTKAGPVILKAAYSNISDGNNWPGTVGNHPDTLCYTNTFDTKVLYAGVEAYSLGASYKISKGLSAMLKHTIAEQSAEGREVNRKSFYKSGNGTKPLSNIRVFDKWNETYLMVNWNMSFLLKGLSSRATIAYVSASGDYAKTALGDGSDHTLGWYHLTYNF